MRCGAMKLRINRARADKLYVEALDVMERRKCGFWVPRMQYLALRGYADAMIVLANWYSESGTLDAEGRPGDASSAAGLYRRAYRQGSAMAAQAMAMGCFNRGDMKGYRHWLGMGARAGDGEAQRVRRLFETRLPHSRARRIGRLRPWQERD